MKKILMTLGVALLVGVLSIPAMAQGPGSGSGRGPMQGNCPLYGGTNENLTDEQRTQLSDLHKKFFDETAQTRNQVWSKKGELRTIMSSPNPDVEKAKALQKEISDLKGKLAQAKIDYQLQERKINPDARFALGHGPRGKGRGPCGKGFGHGMGAGRMMGGSGPGCSWN